MLWNYADSCDVTSVMGTIGMIYWPTPMVSVIQLSASVHCRVSETLI